MAEVRRALAVVVLVMRAAAAKLNESRIAAYQECLALELLLGRDHEIIAELTELMDAFEEEAAHAVVETLKEMGGAPQCTVLGSTLAATASPLPSIVPPARLWTTSSSTSPKRIGTRSSRPRSGARDR